MSNWLTFKKKIEHCLCPPGNGVYTVNTAKERKETLHQSLFGRTTGIESLWQSNIASLPKSSGKAVILGIASDCGGGILRGANWGPLFLRNALLSQYPELQTYDLGDIRVIPHLLHDKYLNTETLQNCRRALYNDEQSAYPVSPLSITEDIAMDFYANFPHKGLFGIGGDHSISYPLCKTYLKAKRENGIQTAVIHFDAHSDLLQERLGIDLCFGSWCTHILEFLPTPANLIQIGIRSSSKPKSHWESIFGVSQHWAKEVKEQGAEVIADKILEKLHNNNVDECYVSFDIDGLDAQYASATGTPEPDGLSPEDAITILQTLSKHYPITGADMMEIAPFVNTAEEPGREPETTLKVGAEISAWLLQSMETL